MEGISFYQTNLENAPFSFFRNLFWKNSIVLHSDLGRQILKHEMVHIEQNHSSDKMFLEIICGIMWFNPFFWMIKKEINLIHEYLADNKAVKKSDTKAFAQMLLASHFSGEVLPGTSPFLSSNLKKRLKMLQKPKSKFSYIRRIMALPLLFLLPFAYMVNAKNMEIKELNTLIEEAVQTQQIVQQKQAEQKKVVAEATPTVMSVERSAALKKLDTIKEKIYEKWDFGDPAVINLYRSTEENLFIIENKEVSKKEYIDYYVRYRRNKDYLTGQFAANSKPLDNGKQAMFTAGKNENQPENIKVVKSLYEKYKDGPKMSKYRTISETVFDPLQKKYEAVAKYFNDAMKERSEKTDLQKKLQEELEQIVASTSLKDNFRKSRNYEENPLTEEEKSVLKSELTRVQKITDQMQECCSYNIYNGFFRTDSRSEILYNLGLNIVKNTAVRTSDIEKFLSSSQTTYFINGKQVSWEEVEKLSDDMRYPEKFLKTPAQIKHIETERITNGSAVVVSKVSLTTK